MRRTNELIVKLRPTVLRRLLAEASIPASEFAHAVELDPTHFCRVLNGQVTPAPATRRKILTGVAQLCKADVVFNDLFHIEEAGQ